MSKIKKVKTKNLVGKLLMYGLSVFVIEKVIGNKIIVVDEFGYECVFLKSDIGISVN